MKKNKMMDFFSALGRSLMMPIAALAACGIVLGLTAALLKPQVVEAIPFLQIVGVNFVITTLNKASAVVFTLIPVLFAISIALVWQMKIRKLLHSQVLSGTTHFWQLPHV